MWKRIETEANKAMAILRWSSSSQGLSGRHLMTDFFERSGQSPHVPLGLERLEAVVGNLCFRRATCPQALRWRGASLVSTQSHPQLLKDAFQVHLLAVPEDYRGTRMAPLHYGPVAQMPQVVLETLDVRK